MGCSGCRAWFEGDPVLEAYHDREWCRPSHDDRFQFEMLVLEGASVGLSWSTIMHKREAYLSAAWRMRCLSDSKSTCPPCLSHEKSPPWVQDSCVSRRAFVSVVVFTHPEMCLSFRM